MSDSTLDLDRTHKAPLYARNGPAVLALRPGPRLYEGDCRAYVMDARDSLDISIGFFAVLS